MRMRIIIIVNLILLIFFKLLIDCHEEGTDRYQLDT